MDLIQAIINNSFDQVKEILDNGGNPNFQPNNHETALSIACKSSDLAIVEMLIRSGASVNFVERLSEYAPIMVAFRRADIPIVNLLLSKGAKIYLKSSAIVSACQGGQAEIIKHMIKIGADVNFKSETNGDTALITAVRINRLDIANTLFKAGANINLKNKRRQSALHIAVANNAVNMVKFLLSADANLHTKNYDGQSAIDLAVNMKHVEILKLLIEKHHILRFCELLIAGVNQDFLYKQINLAQTIINQRKIIIGCGIDYIPKNLHSFGCHVLSKNALNRIHNHHLKNSIATLTEL